VQTVIAVSVAGALGALSRYALAGAVQRASGGAFPVGTVVVNLAGCLLFGLVWGALEPRIGLAPHLRLAVLTGFLGSFTTFSTFAFESASLLQQGQIAAALLNVGLQTAAGLALVVVGLALGRAL